MGNIFTKSNDATPKPNRNTFDGSFVNNLTLKMGQITPCFCKEVIPGDSFRINPTFGFNFQPFVFPVQTDMQANLHFFYVRNRALWKGWMDFITKTENLDGDSTPPYIMLTEENRDMFETGKIGDYLGVPTIKYGGLQPIQYSRLSNNLSNGTIRALFGLSQQYLVGQFFNNSLQEIQKLSRDETINMLSSLLGLGLRQVSISDSQGDLYDTGYTPVAAVSLPNGTYAVQIPHGLFYQYIGTLADSANSIDKSGTLALRVTGWYALVRVRDSKVVAGARVNTEVRYVSLDGGTRALETKLYENAEDGITAVETFNVDGYYSQYRVSGDSTDGNLILQMDKGLASENYNLYLVLNVPVGRVGDGYQSWVDNIPTIRTLENGVSNSDEPLSSLPFVSADNPDGIRVSALPFRAVEACYNSFYRDDRNNPLIIDGKPYYNVYVQNKSGGADTNHYHLYQRNWEADVFTTAVQSPQQGVAPLVGVTASGQMTFQDEEGNSYYLQAEFGEDGHTITGIKSYSSDMPVGTLRAMVDTISTGISINDFRNVNALQRWLETNMRKGLRYKDQIEAHFGTSPTYSELDMPEFIGGMSRRVEVNKVVQTSADTPYSPLGTLGGNATILGGNGSDISCYADEHGWIIGFITITPKPVYSQQLNKQLTKTQLLDYYFPEFAHIGFQPILNQEIAPLQCTDTEGNRLTDVFGYQRAWYEYLANIDEVHGDFRTSLKDYIIHRVFNGVPQLSEEFLTVSTDEANEVFAVKTDDDKIFGQIYFDVKMKRPLPTIGVPKLEVG